MRDKLQRLLDELKGNNMVLLIAGVITIIFAIALGVYYYLAQAEPEITTPEAVSLPKVETPAVSEPTVASSAVSAAVPSVPEEPFDGLIEQSIISQPIPTDPALVKDEIKQLEDIKSQLTEQEALLKQQHADADKLIKLKEQQIEELHKQLQKQATE